MRGVLKRARQQRGQVFILFAGVFAVVMVIAVITLDFGLWLSERRGAQTDADLPALAGAGDLLVLDAGPAEAAAAEASVYEYIEYNDQSKNLGVENLVIDDSCFADNPRDRQGVPDSVTLDVSHEAGPLFSSYFGLPVPDIGAHAKACAGSLVGTTGLRPWTLSMFCSPCFDWTDDGDGVPEVDDDTFTPRFGEDCIIRTDGQTETESGSPTTCDPSSSQVGSVRLGTDEGDECGAGSGDADYRENIWEGSPAWCEIGYPIETEPGLGTGPTSQGLDWLINGHSGIPGEGECDAKFGDGDGIDEFGEAFSPADVEPSPDVVYTANDCTTPRVVNIIIIDRFDGSGMSERPIVGFAAFFIQQCEKNGNVYPDCNVGGGHFQIRGRFMHILELGGAGGPMDPFGTQVVMLIE